jgi:AcrR family transcriptional regulator
MSMSVSYESSGRTNQKARTRQALIAATRALLAEGLTPGVEDAAAAAGISRATAYRYFPNQRAMLVAAHPEIESRSLLGSDAPADPAARLDAVLEEMLRIIVETEPELRTALRLSLEPGAADHERQLLRQGRAIVWIEDAVAPLRDQLGQRLLRQLVLGIRALVGIEALIWLTDVAGLTREQAVAQMRWSAHALLQSARAEAGPGST